MNRRKFFSSVAAALLAPKLAPELPKLAAKKPLTSATLSKAQWIELDQAVLMTARKCLRGRNYNFKVLAEYKPSC